jgi:EAL domain-containing protein (putative c-di-GMP-specific phosphodiesterase class I)
MPRTSYGDEKREQSWKVIHALLQRKSVFAPGELEGVAIGYIDWESDSPVLRVSGTLADLSSLCGNGLSIDLIRESLTEHLGHKFLDILEDTRERRAGRGSDQWFFNIRLWSSNVEENEIEFDKLWKKKRSERSNKSGRLGDIVTPTSQTINLVINNFESVLSPYEGLIKDFLDRASFEFSNAEINKLSGNDFKQRLLEIIQQVSNANAAIIFHFREADKSWFPENISGETADAYSQLLSHEILAKLSKDKVITRESHGTVVTFNEDIFSIIPLEENSSLGLSKNSIIVLCDLPQNSIFVCDPAGRIVSSFYSISKDLLSQSIDNLESSILDALKQSFRFVSPNLYNRRFKIFCQNLHKMTVYFQPIVKLNPIRLYGWEALARDPITLKAPTGLFATAELWGIQFLTELDLYFLRKSTQLYRQAREEIKKNRDEETFPLAVNVYPDSIVRSSYIDEVERIIKSGDLYSAKLTLEISEKCALPLLNRGDDRPTWIEFKEKLREYARRGTEVTFAIDDFGVGHASVGRLVGLGLEYIKIDQEILKYDAPVRDGVIKFVRDTLIEANMKAPQIVLEGVDENYPLRSLLEPHLGAQLIQGYLIGQATEKIYSRLNNNQFNAIKKQLIK